MHSYGAYAFFAHLYGASKSSLAKKVILTQRVSIRGVMACILLSFSSIMIDYGTGRARHMVLRVIFNNRPHAFVSVCFNLTDLEKK